jgi:hypothetical protein
MPKFTRTIILNKPSSHVFQYLSNFDLQKLWIKELVKIEKLDTNDKNFYLYLKEGRKISKYQGKTISSIPNKELVVELSNNSFTSKTSYFLTDKNDTTVLNYQVEMKIHSIFGKIMFILLGYIFSLIVLKNQMSALKKAVEETHTTIN